MTTILYHLGLSSDITTYQKKTVDGNCTAHSDCETTLYCSSASQTCQRLDRLELATGPEYIGTRTGSGRKGENVVDDALHKSGMSMATSTHDGRLLTIAIEKHSI